MKTYLKADYSTDVVITEDEIKSYKENGYLIARDFISRSRISDIKNDAIHIFTKQLNRLGYYPNNYDEFEQALYQLFKQDQETFINCGKHIQHLVSAHRLSLDESIIKVISKFGLNFPNVCTRPVIFFNSKHLAAEDIYHTVPAHQDFKSMQGSIDSMVVWLPLVKVTKDLGALEIVPRSHKHGLMTSSVMAGFGLVDRYTDKDFISVEVDVGDVLFFSSFLVHRSGNNSTDHIRWSAHFRYNNMDDSDFIERKYPHPYIYKPIDK